MVSAKADAGRVEIKWDSSKGTEENHRLAVSAFCAHFGWDPSDFRGGSLGDRYVFVDVSGQEGL